MPRVAQARATLQGHLAGGGDIWTTSFAMNEIQGFSQSDILAAASQIRAHFLAQYWNAGDAGQYHPTTVTFDSVRLDDVRNPGGVYRTATSYNSSPVAGFGGSYQLPSEVSVVASLRTAFPGGRNRGRMYLPPLNHDAVTTGGNIDPTVQAALAASMGSFLTFVNGDAVIQNTVQVASDVAQTLQPVTSVQVGSVFDSQRRRRNALIESYVSAVVTP